MRASRAVGIAVSAALSLTLVVGVLPAAAAAPPTPSSMAAAGDSITRAFNLCFFPFTDCPAQSWSTGTNSTVNSHARRLGITASAFNHAVSGARMVDFPSQAATIDGRNVGYVTLLMGGNDVCRDTELGMTDPASFEADFRAGMNRLAADAPLVYVVSIPNVKMLWEILKDNSSARSAWNSYDICQSLLANPLSTDPADIDRRERVKQRNMELNQRLRAACAAYTFCRFDGEGIFGTLFVPGDVSTRDYFHPSTDGQKKLAAVSYDLGYWGTKGVNGPPNAAFTHSCSALTCTFRDASSDVSGIGGRSWHFGDGRTSTATTATHTFAATGTYDVTLYSIDSLGATAKATQSVSVTTDGGGSGAGTLSGTVTDAATAEPIAGAAVGIDGTTLATTTDSTGGYTLAGVPAGDHSLTASAEGFDPLTKEVTVVQDQATEVDFALSAPSGGGEMPTLHVGDLDGQAARATRGSSWTATVTILVVDASNIPVSGAAVSGDWRTGGSASCTTSTTGRCSVSVSLNSKKVSSTTFDVRAVALSGYGYDAASNTDPDGDSTGTSITIVLT